MPHHRLFEESEFLRISLQAKILLSISTTILSSIRRKKLRQMDTFSFRTPAREASKE